MALKVTKFHPPWFRTCLDLYLRDSEVLVSIGHGWLDAIVRFVVAQCWCLHWDDWWLMIISLMQKKFAHMFVVNFVAALMEKWISGVIKIDDWPFILCGWWRACSTAKTCETMVMPSQKLFWAGQAQSASIGWINKNLLKSWGSRNLEY